MILTEDNYYTPEADREYMSCSQYQDFLRCEAAALAKIQGRYRPEETEALIVGNYLHSAMESDEAHAKFCEEHVDKIYKLKTDKKTGETVTAGKYAPFVKADVMIATLGSDPLCQTLIDMPGENERIFTGTIFGVPWKAKFDKYIPDKRIIVDYKTAADLNRTEYNPATGERESFIESLGYMMRAAIYTEIEKQTTGKDTDASFIILAVTKQDPPDKGAYLLNHSQRYEWELEEVKKHLPRIVAVREGIQLPRRCGSCEYCRRTKVLSKIVPYYTLNPRFREEREEEYDAVSTENL